MAGLSGLKAIWDYFTGAAAVAGIKQHMRDLTDSQRQAFGLLLPPALVWVATGQIKVNANADNPARVMMSGFPNPLNPGQFLLGASDGWYREIASAVTMDFANAAHLWGLEKASQWYAVLAVAAVGDSAFSLKAMPWLRFSSQASQVITLRNNLNSANTGYGWTTDSLAGGQILVISGTSQGLLRTITANNNDSGTAGTITYSGAALTMSQGDWFIVLPPSINFRWLGDIYNSSSSNLISFYQNGNVFRWGAAVNLNLRTGAGAVVETVPCAPPLAIWLRVNFVGTGGIDGGINLPLFAAADNTGITYSLPTELSYNGATNDRMLTSIAQKVPYINCKLWQAYTSVYAPATALEFHYPRGYF